MSRAFRGTLGIVGGGQLGRMIAQAGHRLGYRAHVLCESADDPAALLADDVTFHRIGAPMDALRPFIEAADVYLCEFENIDPAVLEALSRTGRLFPSARIIGAASSRIEEKRLFRSENTAAWEPIDNRGQLAEAFDRLGGGAAVLKTVRLGYDGRGQALIEKKEQIDAAWERVGGESVRGRQGQAPFLLERFVPFDREISVIVVRAASGEMVTFGPIWNIHDDHILRVSVYPPEDGSKDDPRDGPRDREDARVVPGAARKAARNIAEGLGLVGILTIEMFVRGQRVFLNEMAPRPHNSGHLTIEACERSQFEMFIRAACGLPLGRKRVGSERMPITPAVMINLLGDMIRRRDALARVPGNHVHDYGKKGIEEKRKMGHVTRLFPPADRLGEAERQAMAEWVRGITGRPYLPGIDCR